MASTPSPFEAIFQAALDKCPDQTVERLQEFRHSSKIDECNSPESILNIFRDQANALDDSKNSFLMKYIEPVTRLLYGLVNSPVIKAVTRLVSHGQVLFFFSDAVFTQAFPPAPAIFSVIGLILSVRIFPHSTASPSHLRINRYLVISKEVTTLWSTSWNALRPL